MISKDWPLKDLNVLAVDCQATGSGPKSADLLEIGWLGCSAGFHPEEEALKKAACSFLVGNPRKRPIPRPVSEITGIREADRKKGQHQKNIWKKLLDTALSISEANRMNGCPAVAHFARYEEPFLRSLHDRYSSGNTFPFQMICTHKIIGRLLPGLPRKSLRAAAGYFGLSLPKHRRSLTHVLATAHIWSHLVPLLEQETGIRTYRHLVEWLADPPVKSSSAKRPREFPMDRTYLQDLPDSPGVYMMYRLNWDLLYVGKAKSLKHRVAGYFRGSSAHSEHIFEMLSQARALTFTKTPTAFQASLLESDLIKDLSPCYNVALRKEDKCPVFFLPDLSGHTARPHSDYPLGPVHSPKYLTALYKLLCTQTLRFKASSAIRAEILNLPAEYVPSPGIFRKGIEEIRKEYALPSPPQWTLPMLIRLGTVLWVESMRERERIRAERAEADQPDSPAPAGRESVPVRGMDPKRVSSILKFIIRNGCLQMRRAKWLSRLSESCLIWDNPDGENQGRNLAFFSGGRLQSMQSLRLGEKIPPGLSLQVPHGQRLKHFDIYTYDRMRILSSEIKRLLAEKRSVWLRLESPSLISEDKLRRMALWV